MTQVTRIAYANLIIDTTGAVVVPSSEQVGFTRSSLLTGLISDVLRFKVGWTVVAGVNDQITFNRGGLKNATVAAGVYTTAAALCTAIDTAMTAADGATAWVITYSGTTHKFTISGSGVAHVLLFGTGGIYYQSIALDIGFEEKDYASATINTGVRVSYQSRHWIAIDLGATPGGGLVVVAGTNDSIDWDIGGGGAMTAYVAPGFYSTPDDLAAAVITALEISNGGPGGIGWTCTYDTGTNRFTLGGQMAPAYVNFRFSTGAHKLTSVRAIMGFTATDVGLHWNEATGAPAAATAGAITAALVRGHNVSAGGAIRFDLATVSMTAFPLGSYNYTIPLSGTDVRAAYFAEQHYRFLRYVFDDVTNPTGFVEVAIIFAGTSIEPTGLQANAFSKRNEQLSTVSFAAGGAHQMVRRRRRRIWSMTWKLFSQAEEDAFDALDLAMPAGANFFITLDATGTTPVTLYGFLLKGLEFSRQLGQLRYLSFEFAEALD